MSARVDGTPGLLPVPVVTSDQAPLEPVIMTRAEARAARERAARGPRPGDRGPAPRTGAADTAATHDLERTRSARHQGKRPVRRHSPRPSSALPVPTPVASERAVPAAFDASASSALPQTRAARRAALEAQARRRRASARTPLAVTRPAVGVLALMGVLTAAQAAGVSSPAQAAVGSTVAMAQGSAPSAAAAISAAQLDQASRAATRETLLEITSEKSLDRAEQAAAEAAAVAQAAAEAAAAQAAAEAEARRLAPPVDGPMSSGFGYRSDPFGYGTSMHAGQDFVASCGVATKAAADGTVVESGWMGGYGWRVVVEHAPRDGQTFRTTYNHMSQQGIRVGTVVAKGDVVGLVGSTGSSTGCHVHFEVQVGGNLVNPSPYF